ncbi:rho GTPase-activating protein 23-like isoform X7 [Cololabis saira]|uniref:rho GTPase-activating protein 23-like isoform X7 n=1 Tax=Cololabis saira TaxID=129043 RepID=UPI002AD52368|nr:rho GTPase-activating protein 23-like isoform X7 [Cololabis saira]
MLGTRTKPGQVEKRGGSSSEETKTIDPLRNLGVQEDEDVQRMMQGSSMMKVRSPRWQKQRFLKLLDDGVTVWCQSNKTSSRAKEQQSFSVTEVQCVREGCQSETFRKMSGSVPENRCLTVVFKGARKSLDLVLQNQDEAQTWTRGIRTLQDRVSNMTQTEKLDHWIQAYLSRADQNHDDKMSYEEVQTLLQMINVDVSDQYARSLFQKCDRSCDGRLDHEEIEVFCRELLRRPELDSIFLRYSANGCVLSTLDLRDFLLDQDEDASGTHAESLVLSYELNPWAQQNRLMTPNGFTMYMLSKENLVLDPDQNRVHQDMSRPLADYYVSSSHNTYLSGDQLTGASSTEPYIRALSRGCRCVELDCWDGDAGEPVIYHGHTLTSKVPLKDVLETIDTYAFKASPYPLILSLENHCSLQQQEVLARHLRSVLGEKLLLEPLEEQDSRWLPSPQDLKGKILIKGKKKTEEFHPSSSEDLSSDDEEGRERRPPKEGPPGLSPALSDLVFYTRSVAFKSFQEAARRPAADMCSFSESRALRLVRDQGMNFVRHNSSHLSRIYPSGQRLQSSNYNPVDMWNAGCQIVALNFQTPGEQMDLNQGRFLQNGGCGYVLKPPFMRGPETRFNPENVGGGPGHAPVLLTVRVISAQQLPRPPWDKPSSIVDPQVWVEIHGVAMDNARKKTPYVDNNGFNPRWDCSFTFTVHSPALALVRFVVEDHDFTSRDDFLGQFTLPLGCLRSGDRLVKVNGETVLGKTYSEVISLIQNSENFLELCIMPKDEDVLQLVSVFSQDAYLRGNEPFSGEAGHLPAPPALCCVPAGPRPPLDNWASRPSGAAPLDNRPPPSGWPGGPDDPPPSAPPGRRRGRSSSAINALDFHFANHNAAISSATLPPPRRGGLRSASCQQALADWYYSQAEAGPPGPPQDRLAELALGLGRRVASSAEQRRREALLRHHQAAAAAAAHDSYWGAEPAPGPDPGTRTCSEGLLAAYAEYEHNYGRSVEALAKASALVAPHRPQGPHMDQNPQTGPPGPQTGPQTGRQVAEPQTRRGKDPELPGYQGFSRKAGPLLQQASSFREPGYSGPQLDWADGAGGVLGPGDRDQDQDPAPGPPGASEVVLRQKPPAGRRTPVQALRHSHYATPGGSPPSSGAPSPVPGPGPGPVRRANGSLAQHALDSLSSIPFIGSIKSRRSSYLLAVTTERSKSCDEGLNTFRDEGRVFSKLPKRVKSFFTDGSLESLRAQEEARVQEENRSKRRSTSDLGSISFSDVRKEGWLHLKQILTEKGKKVGGGMRPWKRCYSVLRSHSLFLYKDKREAALAGAGTGPGPAPGAGLQDDAPPISLRGCLVDIAYSGTRRKHALRLTTQDFCEYLLQAEDRDDMLAWIRVVRETGKTDTEEMGFSRQALINKKLNDYRKHSLTGSKPDSSPKVHRMVPPFLLAKTDNTCQTRGSRSDDIRALWGINLMKTRTRKNQDSGPKAFGVRLEDCQPAVNHKMVPLVVEMCCRVVEDLGLDYTGVYRVPGNNAMVSNLQDHLDRGLDLSQAEERWQDLNVISSLLKSFFRKLPEPLFTDEKYNDFINANRIEDSEDRLKTMKKLLQDLPDHYYHTLRFLVTHLKKVADHSEKNKMEPRNLALVFGPTLVRTSEDNMTDMVTHMPDRYKIVETLILHCDWFFSDGQLDNKQKALEQKHDVLPVPNIDHLLSNIGRPGMPGETSDSTTSGSVKSKVSSGSRKDLTARDFLPRSLFSAVTRKRKKPLVGPAAGGADGDSDHEPVKTSNLGGEEEEGEGGEREEDGDQGGKEEPIPGEGTFPKPGEPGHHPGNDPGNDPRRGTEPPATTPARPLRPNSFYSRPAPASDPPSHQNQTRTRTRPPVPFWISPSRPPNLYQALGTRNWTQNWTQTPVRYRRTRAGRTRATSMNLDLDLDLDQDPGRWETDQVEVVRVPVPGRPGGVPQGSALGPGSPGPGPGPGSGSGSGSAPVVLRRSNQDPRDKTRAWRRHTVVV